MILVLILGPTVYIFSSFFQNVGFYIQRLPQLALWTETYQGPDSNWQAGWTVFYWGWWISWSPFVGMFIARVSKGRTIREFIVGVMLLPTLLSFFWMSVFGGTAIFFEQSGADVSRAVNENVATALFEMFQNLPFTGILSFIGIVLVVFFFVTSSDSGSLVVDHLTSGGKLDSPVPQRVFWAIMEGLIAAVLLLGGGLSALQTASITAGLPFTIVLLIMIYSLRKGLHDELFHLDAIELKDVIERTPIDVETLEGGLPAPAK
jgi:choline/glycine/proline betaine transport protein